MKSKRALIVAAFAVVELGCSERGTSEEGVELHTSSFRFVGTTSAVLGEAIRTRMGARSQFAFTTDTERIGVVADDFQFSGAYLSAAGTALESDRSEFILKGDMSGIYGWVVLHDRNIAYEYTTSPDGRVLVEKVPVTKIFPVCESDGETFEGEDAEIPGPSVLTLVDGPAHVGAYDGMSDTNKLQSKPGAAKVLFMDVAPLPLEKAQLWRAWQIVAASFSAFDVNVTTDAAVYDATPARDRGKSCSRPEPGRSSCGLNAFGTGRCCNVYNKRNGYAQGTTTAHELGHLMGLRHDGSTTGGAYFGGFASFRWCPIMGANPPKLSWGAQALFQWSKGEYANANNTQDDLQVISRNLPFRADDIPDSQPLIIKDGSQVSPSDNFGQIARNTDSDTFTFAVGEGGGRALLTVDRIEDVGGGYLDVEAEIQNASGMVLVKGNDMVARTAKLDVMLPAGEYKLMIKGGAEGTPQTGFSSYSSLGFYGVSGTIASGVGGGTGGGSGMGAPDGAAGGSEPDAGVVADAGNMDPGTGSPAGSGAPPGGAGGSGRTSGEGAGAAPGGVAEPAFTPRPDIQGGCAVAGPSAQAPGSAGALLLMLAIALLGRRPPRCRQAKPATLDREDAPEPDIYSSRRRSVWAAATRWWRAGFTSDQLRVLRPQSGLTQWRSAGRPAARAPSSRARISPTAGTWGEWTSQTPGPISLG